MASKNKEQVEFIRVAGLEDVQRTAELARKIWTEHYIPIIGPDQVEYMLENFQSPEAIREQIQGGSVYYLALYRGEEAGYLAFEPDQADRGAKLSKLYVRSELRRMGIGRRILEYACRVCRKMGWKRLWLTVNRNNHGAIAFYKQMGFEVEGTLVQDIGQGFVMDDYKMVKKISPRCVNRLH